ncbi:unnamed protein product [Anisakis simplex]|uniref:Uncharacterized protein n=1 Tax=Anisakis simplex TaxID=6269 RepID=A0A0M3KJK4_ANISI|nr:unnamed protein product [Anisakis simplex]
MMTVRQYHRRHWWHTIQKRSAHYSALPLTLTLKQPKNCAVYLSEGTYFMRRQLIVFRMRTTS